MRVALHVGQLLQPTPGGIGRYVQHLLRELPAAGVQVTTFAAGGVEAAAREAWPGYVELGAPRGALRYECWHRLRRPRVRLPVDVVHAPSLAVPPVEGAALVVTVHDVAFLRVPDAFTRRGVAFHRRGLALARAADAIIVPSRFTRAELVAEGFDAARIHVAPHGRDPVPPLAPQVVERRLADAGAREPYLLFVGTFEPRKGLPTLLTAFDALAAAHPEVQLVVVGRRGWGPPPPLDHPRVHVLEDADDETLDALYRRAAVVTVPSRSEGFGFPALEAMARGAPVVASDVGALAEVVGDAGVLVAPDDAHAWREAIDRLLVDADARRAVGEAGRAQAEPQTWERSVQAHLAAYESAVARR